MTILSLDHDAHRPEHYRFQRQQRLYTPPLERTPLLLSWCQIAFGVVCLAIALFLVMALVSIAGAWLTANRWIAPAW